MPIIGHGLTFLFALILWWVSTGAILWLCTLPKRTFGWSLLGGTVVAAAATFGLVHGARSASTFGTYESFLSAVTVWGWLEMSFLMGYVTGPRTTPCPPDASGWRRFRLAVATLLYRELAVVGAALVVVALTWGAVNQVGTFTFLILLVMRISAELNIFLGVPHLPDALLPDRLGYLISYFRTRRFNLLFPVSIGAASILAFVLAQRALGTEGAEAIGFALLFTILVLAILEHCFMMMPINDAALWRWAKPIEKVS